MTPQFTLRALPGTLPKTCIVGEAAGAGGKDGDRECVKFRRV